MHNCALNLCVGLTLEEEGRWLLLGLDAIFDQMGQCLETVIYGFMSRLPEGVVSRLWGGLTLRW